MKNKKFYYRNVVYTQKKRVIREVKKNLLYNAYPMTMRKYKRIAQIKRITFCTIRNLNIKTGDLVLCDGECRVVVTFL